MSDTLLPGPVEKVLDALPKRTVDWGFRQAMKFGPARRQVEAMYDDMLSGVADGMRPYRGETTTYASLPKQGVPRDEDRLISPEYLHVQGFAMMGQQDSIS